MTSEGGSREAARPDDPAAGPRRRTFSRGQRIQRRGDFLRIQGTGVRVTTPHLLLLLAPRLDSPQGAHESGARFGIVASRKVGGAVERNRAKRLLREAFRSLHGLVPPGVDCVVIVRAGTHKLRLADVEAELVGASRWIRRRSAEVLAHAAASAGPPRASYS